MTSPCSLMQLLEKSGKNRNPWKMPLTRLATNKKCWRMTMSLTRLAKNRNQWKMLEEDNDILNFINVFLNHNVLVATEEKNNELIIKINK